MGVGAEHPMGQSLEGQAGSRRPSWPLLLLWKVGVGERTFTRSLIHPESCEHLPGGLQLCPFVPPDPAFLPRPSRSQPARQLYGHGLCSLSLCSREPGRRASPAGMLLQQHLPRALAGGPARGSWPQGIGRAAGSASCVINNESPAAGTSPPVSLTSHLPECGCK